MLRLLFEGLKELEYVNPPELMGDVHQNLLPHLKHNLGLPARRITKEMLAAEKQPFMQEVEDLHTTIVEKIWTDVLLPCGVTLFTLGLLLSIGCGLGLKWGKLYAMRKFEERFRRRKEETAAVVALQLSNIETAEEGVVQQEKERKLAPPKMSQGETSSKKSPPKK